MDPIKAQRQAKEMAAKLQASRSKKNKGKAKPSTLKVVDNGGGEAYLIFLLLQ